MGLIGRERGDWSLAGWRGTVTSTAVTVAPDFATRGLQGVIGHDVYKMEQAVPTWEAYPCVVLPLDVGSWASPV